MHPIPGAVPLQWARGATRAREPGSGPGWNPGKGGVHVMGTASVPRKCYSGLESSLDVRQQTQRLRKAVCRHAGVGSTSSACRSPSAFHSECHGQGTDPVPWLEKPSKDSQRSQCWVQPTPVLCPTESFICFTLPSQVCALTCLPASTANQSRKQMQEQKNSPGIYSFSAALGEMWRKRTRRQTVPAQS